MSLLDVDSPPWQLSIPSLDRRPHLMVKVSSSGRAASINSAATTHHQAIMTTLQLGTRAEVNGFILAITNSVNSASELLQSIADALELATTLAKEPRHIPSLQSSIDGHLSRLRSLLESTEYSQITIFSGQLMNASLSVGTPAESINISIPLLNLGILGLSDPIRISETIEGFPLIPCSAVPNHYQITQYGGLEPAFRESLAIHFNSIPSGTMPLPKGMTALELLEIIQRHVHYSVFEMLGQDAIEFYFGGRFDPATHVDMLNKMTTISGLTARITSAQKIISDLRVAIESLTRQLLRISEAKFRTEGTTSESAATTKLKNKMSLLD